MEPSTFHFNRNIHLHLITLRATEQASVYKSSNGHFAIKVEEENYSCLALELRQARHGTKPLLKETRSLKDKSTL
jgi:hypothetical protein